MSERINIWRPLDVMDDESCRAYIEAVIRVDGFFQPRTDQERRLLAAMTETERGEER